MDFRDKVFIAVADNLSFSKAAKELFISQPAVTKHIKELENKLNIALFERRGSRIILTKAGKIAYTQLNKIKQQYNELEFELGRLNDAFKGTLRIGASSTISQYVIPSVIAAFHKRYPKIQLFLYCGNSFQMEEKLLENGIDIALVENSSSHPNIQYSNFLEDEIVVIARSNCVYARNKSLSLADFKNIPIVLREKGSGTLEVIQKKLAKQKISFEKLNILIHLGSTEAIKNFLTEFAGIALVSEKAIEKEIHLKFIKVIQVKNLNINRYYRTALRQGPASFTANLFMKFLSNYNF